MNSVRGLVLLGSVPPSVIVNHDRRGHKIDPGASGLKAPQVDFAVGIFVEPGDDLPAISTLPGECDKADPLGLQILSHDLYHPKELAVDHHLLPAIQAFGQYLLEEIPFPGPTTFKVSHVLLSQKCGVIADLL